MAQTVVKLSPFSSFDTDPMVISNTRLVNTNVQPNSASDNNLIPRNRIHDHGDLAMEESDILDQLRDANYIEHRAFLLDQLQQRLRRDAGQVSPENRQELFLSLAHSLVDRDVEVKSKAVAIIYEVIPHLDYDLDKCMDYVLPQLIHSIGEKTALLRKSIIQTLHSYMQNTSNISNVFHALVKHGIKHSNPEVNMQAVVALPILLTPDIALSDVYPIVQSLAVKVCEENDEKLLGTSIVTLNQIKSTIGDERFESYQEKLPPEVRARYQARAEQSSTKESDELDVNSNQRSKFHSTGYSDYVSHHGADNSEHFNYSHSQVENNGVGFGIIPQNIMNGLMDQENWYERLSAAEKLKSLIPKLDDVSKLQKNFVALISFLCQLLEDLNFKVTIVTIEIIEQLVLKLNQDVKFFLKPVISALTKRFGDNKIVIRQANMRVMKTLMQTLEPKPVIDVLSESLTHKKSGVREEALHIIIAALLTFPSNDFDLPKLCNSVAHTLGDPKRKVRQASLETFAVLAQAMGPTKISPLIRAVDRVELDMNDEGVMKAVQARLARRQLPRINGEDMVELPSPLPSSASSRSASSVAFDTVWILKAAGSTGSAKDRSYTDPAIELSQPSPNKSAVTSNGSLQDLVPPKRFYSAGRGRSKLPWEEDRDDRPEDTVSEGYDGYSAAARGHVSSAPAQEKSQDVKPPYQPRQTWNGSEPNIWANSTKERRPRRGFLIDKQDLRETAGFGGSYRQNHLDKMKMMSLAPMKTDVDEAPFNGSHSAPVSDRVDSDPFPLTASILSKKRDEDKIREIWNERRIVYDSKQRVPRRPKDLSVITKSPRRSFSNSWPDGSFGEDMQPQRNAVSNTPKRSAGYYTGPTAPIPQKATLARSASRSRNKDVSPREEIIDLDFDDGNPLGSPDSDDGIGAADFLQSVRSSAQKKRAQKQAKTSKSSSSYHQNSETDLRDSAFFDNFTPMNSAVEERDINKSENTSKNASPKRVPPDSPFSSKPRIVRSSSGRNPRKGSAELVNRRLDLTGPDFSSGGGANFRDDDTAEVTVVGKGYSLPGQEGMRDPVVDDKLAAVLGGRQQNPRERRRQQKGPGPSPSSFGGGLSVQYQSSGGEVDEWMSSDNSAVRGRESSNELPQGVFGNHQNGLMDPHPAQNRRNSNRKERADAGFEDPPEIVGFSFQQNNIDDETSKSDDEGLGMSMSRAVMDKISQKQEKQRKARNADKVSRDVSHDVTEIRSKFLDEERQRLKGRNESSGTQRATERGKADLAEESDRSESEAEEERQRQIKAQRFEEEVQREKEYRLEEERRRASAERKKRLQVEEKRRQEEEEYRRLEMEERRIQAEERQRMEEQRRLAEERKQVEEESMRRRRLDEEEEMRRLIQAEEDKYAAEEFEEDQTPDFGRPPVAVAPRENQRPPPAAKRKKTKSPKSPGNRGLSQSISGSVTVGQEAEAPPRENNYERTDEIKPLSNPSVALRDALQFLEQEDWEIKNDGLNLVRRLSLHHPQEFGSQLHTVVVAVLAEVKNLRSNVSKSAIVCLGDMFEGLNVALDKDLDQICRVIMPKALESNSFIRNSLDAALMSMVHNVSPQRALSALISVGASHNSKMVRKTTAQFLEQIVERMGPGRILSGIKDVTDKVLLTTAKLAMDPYQDTRYYARKIVLSLMQHEDFGRLIEKHVPQRDLKSFQEVVVHLRTKGLTEPNSGESLSAKGSRRSLSNSRANSGSNSHLRASSNGSANGERTPPTSVKKSKRSSARSEGQQESVAELVKGLTSSDWREKISAVEQFREVCETDPTLVTANMMKIFDGFCPRLADSNSKVCCVALDTMKQVIPHIADGLVEVIPELVAKLVKSLASKNNTIYQSSNQILDTLMDHVDNAQLVHHFANATKCANARVKPPMIDKLTRLVVTVFPKKPQLIMRQILPVLWDILGNMTSSGAIPGGSGNLRKATKALVMSLYEYMGKDLLQEASSLPQRSRTALDGLLNS